MPHTTLNWLAQQDASTPTPRVPPAVEYHRVYAGEKRRILRGIFAIILLLAGLICFAQLSLEGARLIDTELLGRTGSSPLQQAAGALSLAAFIPYSMLLQRLLYGIPFRSLHSVAGCFRFGVFGRALLAFGPLVVITVSLVSLMMPSPPAAWTMIDLIVYFVIGMLLTPLAAAGEEYGFRGFMFRVVGGWSRSAHLGTIIGIIIPTVFFSLFPRLT